MYKLIFCLLSNTLDCNRVNVCKLICELLHTLQDEYHYEKIKYKVLELLADTSKYLSIDDVDKEKCIDVIGRHFPHAIKDSIKFISFNNVTMEVRFTYSVEGYEHKNVATISAYSNPEIIMERNDDYEV